ncbi:hypoxanthine phosphoribosyltransferase [Acididesulfobacillus acetoxydans]|uniref:Hypoxanthine phosphoribosyltransferase n=1 Tax=Acididesulfobacillus acetoxydans TaxID=1561005 RepID=A0A8S0WFE5_9FIRM|nr:hypoxanthine phosphoribosyltransferase [Acididesulfobacillus acetoxydans]CAA7600972.1 hypoxanthine phosphoribosyltransferase [Acididesulfobacillus acetoxydans]CEJ07695.1 Hypoxanthine-guanine phosphoribosyltransferase [Acididesulfobacillus acetoxydans]
MENDIARVLVTNEELKSRIAELGAEITRDYAGKELLVLGILKGAVLFMADLVREIRLPLTFDFLAVSSYGASTSSSGVVRILKDVERSVEGVHILIAEDIVDTGLTLKYLKENLYRRHPESVKVVTLLDKPGRRKVEVVPDYNGFVIPDEFVVGFGLDFGEKYRNLPYVAVLKPSAYEV